MADRHFRRERKEKSWSLLPGLDAALTGSGTSLGGQIAFTSPQTVIRMIGEIVIVPTTAPAAQDNVQIATGIAKVSTDAFNAGAASMPDPGVEFDFPWLYHRVDTMFFGSTSADPSSAGGSVRDRFDVRTMRKFKSGESLVWVVQYTNVTGFPPIQYLGGGARVLLTVH